MDRPTSEDVPSWSDGDEVEVNPVAFAPAAEVLAAMERVRNRILEELLARHGIPPAEFAEFGPSPLLAAYREMLRKDMDDIFYGRRKPELPGGL